MMKMSQQTSIHDFYKSSNPKRNHLHVNKKLSPSFKTLIKKQRITKSKGEMQKVNVSVSTPSEFAKKFSNQITGSDDDFVDLVDSNDESSSAIEGIKTQRLSQSLTIPTTPTRKEKKTLKRTLSGSRLNGSSSPKKKSQSSGSRAVTKHLKHRSPKSLFHHEVIDAGRVSDTIEHLNLSRVGVVPKNRFDLEKFYSTTESEAEDIVNVDMNDIPTPYDVSRVVIPKEKHAEHLFYVVHTVFYNATNCGYFNDQELDLVFSILTLSERAQMLFARMIKRKCGWKRASSIEYPEIGSDLKPFFKELEENKLVSSDMGDENIETLLRLLSMDDLRDICKQSSFSRPPNKESAITQLLKNSSIKSLFPGIESPAAKLRKAVLTSLNYCIHLPEEVVSLVDRIVVLFIPSEDVSSTISDMFLKLTMIKEGTLRFPEVPVRCYPVFETREHLISYVESKNKWRQAMEMPKGNKENWETFRTLGRDADRRLRLLLEENPVRHQHVPRHVQKFSEEYVCIKIIISCLEIFKKENQTIPEAVEMLRNLINQESYLQSRKGEWYEELALIEMKHRKNLEAAALVTIEGLSLQNITETGKHVLTKRASTIAKRKSGLNNSTKSLLKDFIDKEMLKNTPTVSINANVMQGNQAGRKSTWSIDMGDGEKGYMSVEHRAKYYYQNNGYPDGWHCEGSLPVTLFTLLMWEELYGVSVSAAYLSIYQKAPLDLYTSEFYKNRKIHLDQRIEDMRAMSDDQLGELVERTYEIRQHYECLMPTSSPHIGSKELGAIVRCLGTNVVAGICKRMASNFSGWRAGFPDLLVWNPVTVKCKIVEVKGPGDTLSAKQTLWLRYLEDLGAATELCEVKAGGKSRVKT